MPACEQQLAGDHYRCWHLCLRPNAQSPSCENKNLSQKCRFQKKKKLTFVQGHIFHTSQACKGLRKFSGPKKVSDTCWSKYDYAKEHKLISPVTLYCFIPLLILPIFGAPDWYQAPAVWVVPRVILGEQDRGRDEPWAACRVSLLRLLSILSFAECHHHHVHCHWGLILSSVLQLQLQRSPQCPVSQNSCVSHRKLSYISSVH